MENASKKVLLPIEPDLTNGKLEALLEQFKELDLAWDEELVRAVAKIPLLERGAFITQALFELIDMRARLRLADAADCILMSAVEAPEHEAQQQYDAVRMNYSEICPDYRKKWSKPTSSADMRYQLTVMGIDVLTIAVAESELGPFELHSIADRLDEIDNNIECRPIGRK